MQQLIAGNGTINGSNPPVGDNPVVVPPVLPTPGGPNQVFCQVGFYRGGDGNCYAIIPTPQGPPIAVPPVVGSLPPKQIMCGPGMQNILGICVPINLVPPGWAPKSSGVSGYEANGKSFFYNNGSLQSVGILGSTSNISQAVAPKGWKPAASGVSGYESNGYAAYYNNGSLQSVSKLGQK